MSLLDIKDPKQFLTEFIEAYKNEPLLWNKNHPLNKSKSARNHSYKVLAKVCKKYVPEADEDYVKLRIGSIRTVFGKECKKIAKFKEEGHEYVPQLWYFNMLKFVMDEHYEINEPSTQNGVKMEAEELINEETEKQSHNGGLAEKLGGYSGTVVKIPFWERKFSLDLIELYKKQRCLYDKSESGYTNTQMRKVALKKIKDSLEKLNPGKTFIISDIQRKFYSLRTQFGKEVERLNGMEEYDSRLWCYDKMLFLKDHLGEERSKSKKRARRLRKENITESSPHNGFATENSNEKLNNIFHIELNSQINEPPKTDGYDEIGNNIAIRLRDMTKNQRDIAERILHDLMYHGQMENLTESSKLILND